jgi:hypothetical protein
MALGEQTAGLLNLAAFAAAACIAYLGLDSDPGQKQLQEAKDRAELEYLRLQKHIHELFLRLGLTDPSNLPNVLDSYLSRRLFLLRMMYDDKVASTGLKKITLWLWAFWKAPLFLYFRRSLDIRVVGLLLFYSLVTFLAMSAATVWRMPLLDSIVWAKVSFALLSTTILVVISQSLLYRRLSIERLLYEIQEEIDQRLKSVVSNLIHKAQL